MCDNVCIEVNETVENISIEVRDFSVSNIISDDVGNAVELGSDGLLYVPPNSGGSGVTSFNSRTGDVIPENGDYNTSQVTEVTDKKYVTDSEKTVLSNTSGVNTGDQDLSGYQLKLTEDNFGAFSDSLTEKTTIVDADKFNITDSADANKQKKFTFANLKIAFTSFFNGLFAKVNLDSTTTISGTGVNINAGDSTKFDINIVGKIVNPTTFAVAPISVNLVAQTVTHLAAQTESYIWVNSSGTVVQSLTPPTPDLFDSIIGHWVLVHSNKINLNVVNDFTMFSDGVGVQLMQALSFDGFRKKQNSNIVSAGTTGTRLSHSGGLVMKAGGGGLLTKRPVFSLNSAVDATFRMRNRDDVEGADTLDMGVNSIDIGGVTTTLSNNKFGAHKVWKFSSSLIRVQRGQKQYDNIDDALVGIDVDSYVDSPNGSRNGIHIGWVIFKKGTTWAGGTAGVDYKFVDVVGGKSSGGGFIANLQSSYNISFIPQIITNAVKGAFTLQGGTGIDTDNIFEGKNNAGATTSWIKADGTSSFGSGSSANKQTFQWWGGNWSTPTLGNIYYIGYNGGVIEGLGTTVSAVMNGRNKGLFTAPFNCKIKRVFFRDMGSGSYTGNFILASGQPNWGGTWNIGYSNIVTHLNSAITSTGSNANKFELLVTDDITVPKGYVVSPMLQFSAQAGASKLSIDIIVEIEEVI